MLKDEYREMINLYFDNELPKGKETVMFEMLSNNPEAQEYFTNLHRLSRELKATDAEFPQELEEKILRSLTGESGKMQIQKSSRIYFYAAAVAVFIIFGFLYTEMNSYKNELMTLNKKIINQNETIMQLYNNLPAAVVTAESKNEVIVKANL